MTAAMLQTLPNPESAAPLSCDTCRPRGHPYHSRQPGPVPETLPQHMVRQLAEIATQECIDALKKRNATILATE